MSREVHEHFLVLFFKYFDFHSIYMHVGLRICMCTLYVQMFRGPKWVTDPMELKPPCT